VVGGSFGGILAHQVVLEAKKAGDKVCKLIMLDPLPPAPWSNFRADKLNVRYAATFLLRLSLLPNWEEAAESFKTEPENALGVRVAEELAKAGRRPFSATSVLQAQREIHIVQRYYQLTEEFVMGRSKESVANRAPYDGGMLMVNVTERTEFFKSVYHLNAEESGPDYTKHYGRVERAMVVPGGHTELIHHTATNSEPMLPPVVAEFLRDAELEIRADADVQRL